MPGALRPADGIATIAGPGPWQLPILPPRGSNYFGGTGVFWFGADVANGGKKRALVDIDTEQPIWDRFFHVAPLVLVGTVDADGSADLAPKHMVLPLGWQNYFGFVCAPRHSTAANIERTDAFTVSYPRPRQVLETSLSASPRLADGDKPVVDYLATSPARSVNGVVIDDAYLYLECRHHKTVSGFGDNCLITGTIVDAYADARFVRASELDDQELIHASPLFAYLAPGRFATIDRSNAFPFPVDMKK